MQTLGKFDTASDATAFGEILASNAIEYRIDRENDGTCSVWIIDDGKMPVADVLLNEYLAKPAPPAPKPPALQERLAAAPLTTAFIAVSVIVTLITKFGSKEEITYYFYFEPHLIFAGQVWRAVTPIFLHFTIIHILFNMFWLLDLGSMIERRFSRLYLGLLITGTGIVSNVTQFYWDGPYFGGFSGVVYALFGFIWIRSKLDRSLGFAFHSNTVTTMIGWLFLCMTGALGHVANGGHVGGLLAGMAWAFATVAFKRPAA